MARAAEAERSLDRLQRTLREHGAPEPDDVALTRTVPDDLARPGASMLALDAQEHEALLAAVDAVSRDPRLEHLGRQADKDVWRFACKASLDRSHDWVPEFFAEHAHEVQEMTCFFPIEALSVSERRELPIGMLLPVDDPEVPAEGMGFSLGEPVGSVLAIPAVGTHLGQMAERAGVLADDMLRVLRVALRDHRSIADMQLLFRRGIGFSFGEGLSGWKRRPDAPANLTLDDELSELLAASPVTRLAGEPANDVERKAQLALRWIERGALAVDPLESILFNFFALETLLGDKSEGEKASGLAYRRAMLDIASSEEQSFSWPDRVYNLYDKVRSVAVHGGMPPDVSPDVARRFAWDVRAALKQYLDYTQSLGITKRGRLLRTLDEDDRRKELVETLREYGGGWWAEFPLEPPSRSAAGPTPASRQTRCRYLCPVKACRAVLSRTRVSALPSKLRSLGRNRS